MSRGVIPPWMDATLHRAEEPLLTERYFIEADVLVFPAQTGVAQKKIRLNDVHKANTS